MRKFLQYALNRVVITAIIVLMQVCFFLFVLLRWGSDYLWFSMVLRFITMWAVIYIIWRPNNPAVKLAWIVPILLFPLFGGVMYMLFGHVIVPKKLRESMERTQELVKKSLEQDESVLEALEKEDLTTANQSRYITSYALTPVWNHTESAYFPDGESWWKSLLADLEQARRFIFLEFFIIKEGAIDRKSVV